MYILGSKKVYNENKQLIEPVGEERDVYNKWLSNLKTRFLKTKTTIFASMKKDDLMLNVENDRSQLKIMVREKSIGGRSSITLDEPVIRNIVRWVIGEDIPETIKGKQKLNLFLDLVIRRAIVQEKEDLLWFTPQEYDVLMEDDTRKEILKKMKQ
jgi:hypothetical protein